MAIYSTNTVNIGLVERGDNRANIDVTLPLKITKLVARFFERMENHMLEGSYPDTAPAITPRDANPTIHKDTTAMSTAKVTGTIVEKSKADASPPGTPACKRTYKKQKLKKGAGSMDFTKAGLFHCKEGTPVTDLFPADLINKYCSFFCFHNKKCSKPHQACDFDHIGRWDKVPPVDQLKILEHCHARKEKKVWLDADTFTKHKVTIPNKFAYLLGDLEGPKSQPCSFGRLVYHSVHDSIMPNKLKVILKSAPSEIKYKSLQEACQRSSNSVLNKAINKNTIIAQYDKDCQKMGYSDQVTTANKGEPTHLPTTYPSIY